MSQFLAMERRVAVIQAVVDGVLRLLRIDAPASDAEPAAEPVEGPLREPLSFTPVRAAAVATEAPPRRPRSRPRDERYPCGGGEPANQSSATAP